MVEANPPIKTREIRLRGPLAPEHDIDAALAWLHNARGVLHTEKLNDHTLRLSYNLQRVCLTALETALSEVGFHLDNSLLIRLKRALYHYTEENERSRMGLTHTICAQGCATKIFAHRYTQIEHGCRDPRPEHLREYR